MPKKIKNKKYQKKGETGRKKNVLWFLFVWVSFCLGCVLFFVSWHTEVDPDGDELLHHRLGDMEGMVMDGRMAENGRRPRNRKGFYAKKNIKLEKPKKGGDRGEWRLLLLLLLSENQKKRV